MNYASAWIMAFLLPTLAMLSVGEAHKHIMKVHFLSPYMSSKCTLFHLSMALFFYLAGIFLAMATFKLWHNLLI